MDHSVSSSNSSARKSLARAWLGTFTNWDFNTMYSLMTEAPDFHYGYLPTSVGLTPKSRSQWQTYNTFMKDVLPDFNVTILEVHDTSEAGPVIARIEGTATSSTGAPFRMEYIIFIYIRLEQGVLKIYKVEELVDSWYVREYFNGENMRRKTVGTRKKGVGTKL